MVVVVVISGVLQLANPFCVFGARESRPFRSDDDVCVPNEAFCVDVW